MDQQKERAIVLLRSTNKSTRTIADEVGMTQSAVARLKKRLTDSPADSNDSPTQVATQRVTDSPRLTPAPDYSRVVPLVQRISSAIDTLERLLIARSVLSPYLVQEALEPTRYALSQLKVEMDTGQEAQPVVEAVSVLNEDDLLAALLVAETPARNIRETDLQGDNAESFIHECGE